MSNPTDDAYSQADWDGVKSDSIEAKPKTFSYEYETKYQVARTTASIIAFFGYLVFGITLTTMIYMMVKMEDASHVLTLGMLLPLFFGALIIMFAQLVKATVDNADNTGELLAIMKARDDL